MTNNLERQSFCAVKKINNYKKKRSTTFSRSLSLYSFPLLFFLWSEHEHENTSNISCLRKGDLKRVFLLFYFYISLFVVFTDCGEYALKLCEHAAKSYIIHTHTHQKKKRHRHIRKTKKKKIKCITDSIIVED